MDLLGGYGSSGSDSDSDGGAASPRPPPSQPPQSLPKGQAVAPPAGRISKRGRRLLSLNAILPPAIFDRLTRAAAVGGGGGSDSDSDGGEGATKNGPEGARGQQAATGGSGGRGGTGAGEGEMGCLLRDLRSAPAAIPSLAGKAEAGAGAGAAEKMGLAFATVTSTTTTRGEVGVTDVHAPTAASSAAAADAVVPLPPPGAEEAAVGAPPAAPALVAPQRMAAPSASVPRPRPSAAPPVRRSAAPEPPAHRSRAAPQGGPSQDPAGQRPQPQPQPRSGQPQQAAAQQTSRNKSNRELQQALRAGNFDVLDDARTSALRRPDVELGGGAGYAPTEADLAEAAARTGAASAARAGAAGLRMYDPSAGTDIDLNGGVSQKHRSKHQINQLVAQAAVLEAHRAGGVGGRTAKGTSSRVDAKRKYGW